LAEEEDVHAGDGSDFVNVLDAIGGFDLQRDDAVLVPIAGIAEQAIFVHAALGEIDGAVPVVGYFVQLTAWRASAAVLMYGTSTPSAPMSSDC